LPPARFTQKPGFGLLSFDMDARLIIFKHADGDPKF
jgi:hypothetical protein